MNKKLNSILVLGVLFCAVPAKPITSNTAGLLTALSGAGAFFASEAVLSNGFSESLNPTAHIILAGGSLALTAASHWALYRLTPNGRYNRASEIVENMKTEFSRVFGDPTKANQEQILYDLGAFAGTHKNERNFVHLNAVEALDVLAAQLKKAESLLIAAKKDITPEAFEYCGVGVQNLYARAYAWIKNADPAVFVEAKNHTELAAKIDALLVDVRVMQDRLASLFGYLELYGSPEFKQQLKDYEALRMTRSQKTRSAVINFAIPTATITGSLAVAALVVARAWRPEANRAVDPLGY